MRRTVFLVFAVRSLALPTDSWFGADKVKHFFLGAFAQSAAFGGLRAAGLGKNVSFAGASAATLSVIVAKELHDRHGNGTPSLRDAAWGIAGAGVVSPLLLRTK